MDPFSKLPSTILLDIAKLTADLPSLYYFQHASPVLSSLFDEAGDEISEAVMSNSMPPEIQRLVRLIIGVQSGNFRSLSLDAFIDLYLGKDSSSCGPRIISFSLSAHDVVIASPTILREILAWSCQIRHLTQSCLQELIDRCSALQPSHLLQPTFCYMLHPGAKPAGQRYTPLIRPTPSYIEEQCVYIALWRMQLYFALREATLEVPRWHGENGNFQDDMGLEFWKMVIHHHRASPTRPWEQRLDRYTILPAIETVLDYLQDIAADPSIELSRRPLTQFPWTTGTLRARWPSPEPEERICCSPCMHPLETFTSESVGNHLYRLLRVQRNSPLKTTTFSSFRRLGFAIWDRWRMSEMEFSSQLPNHSSRGLDNYMFTWQSILTEE